MRRILFSLLLSAFPAGLLAGDLYVAPTMTRMVRPADLPRHCGTDLKVEACTAFVGQVLTCACEPSGDGWQLRGHAQFIPLMFLTGGARVAHEQEHIDDIRQSVSRYLGDLASETFTSRIACEAAAEGHRAEFPRLMDIFKMRSNERLHPQAFRWARALSGSRARPE